MYKILHKLFGWDYIALTHSVEGTEHYIYRLHTSPKGHLYYKTGEGIIFIRDDLEIVHLT